MRLLVTAGPTREYLDTVRYISNASSGKLGYAVVDEAGRRGHDVVLVAGPVTLPDPVGAKVVHVVSAEEMFVATTRAFKKCHVAVMTAAVCDYRPARRLGKKLKKQKRPRSVLLVPTADILKHLGKVKGKRALIGFALEDRDAQRNVERKLRVKNCDAMVLNTPPNIGADAAKVRILRTDTGWSRQLAGTKAAIAAAVVDLAESLTSIS